MAILKTMPRPADQREDYLFIEDEDTGLKFKALHEGKISAQGQPAVTISVAPVDESGKALLNPAGAPDIVTLTHTFTEVELADPAFDIDARVATMLSGLVERKNHELAGRAKVVSLGSKWGHGGLDLTPPARGE